MLSTKSITQKSLIGLTLLASVAVAASGCGAAATTEAAPSAHESATLKLREMGESALEPKSFDEIAEIASALVEAVPTGNSTQLPLPKEQGGTADSAPIVFIEMKVTEVVAGSLKEDVINVVTPGDDVSTGKPALTQDGPFLMYITPAMYAANQPVGGYVVTAGPAGLYEETGNDNFSKVDMDNTTLPESVDPDDLPEPTKSESTLLREGPK